MDDAGVDQELRMREVGHSNKATNPRYTHPLIEANSANGSTRLLDFAAARRSKTASHMIATGR
jgi:hypothetical protein